MNNHLNITEEDKKCFIEKTNTNIELKTTGILMIDIVNDVIAKYDGKKMTICVINAIKDRFNEDIDSSLRPCVWYNKSSCVSNNYICMSARKEGKEILIQFPIPKDNQIISKETIFQTLNKYKENFNRTIESNKRALEHTDALFKNLYDLETIIQDYADNTNPIFREMFKPFNSFLLR